MKIKTVIAEIISMSFVLLFTYAAVSKLLDYDRFRIEMGKSPVLAGISSWLAWVLPASEIVIAVLLVIPQANLFGLYGALTLMVMFTSYLITVLNFSDFVPCTCGGLLEKLSWNAHIVFNLAFVVLAALALAILPHQKTPGKKRTVRIRGD